MTAKRFRGNDCTAIMASVNFTFEIVVIVLMLGLNAIFAAYEMALASVTRARLVSLIQQRKRGAVAALGMKDRMEASLAVVQLGITLVGAIAAATGGAAVEESFAPWLQQTLSLPNRAADLLALVLFVLPLSALTIIFAELVPKILALNHKERVALLLSPAMRFLTRAAAPVVDFLERTVKFFITLAGKHIAKEDTGADDVGLYELRAAVGMARTARLLGAREERIVLSAAQLSQRRIGEIALPASEISMIPVDASLSDALIRAHLDLHTRFPVCSRENDPQTIEGYITFKDLVAALKMHVPSPTVRGITRPIKRIPKEIPIAQVLEQMMREKLHIALVEEAGSRILGMVTLEDIIEELVGDIEDEADALPAHIHATAGGWIMGGGVPMNAVTSRLGIPWLSKFAIPDAPRLAEWCVKILGRPIKKGDIVRVDGVEVLVRKLRRRKLAEAFVSRRPTDVSPSPA